MKYFSSDSCYSQRWYDVHFPQFECGGGDLASQDSQVVLVRVCDFLDQAVFAQTLEQPRYLMRTLAGQITANIAIVKSADVKFPLDDGVEKIKVIAGEEIEPAVAAGMIFYCSGYLVQVRTTLSRHAVR